jgi:TctA family transporter
MYINDILVILEININNYIREKSDGELFPLVLGLELQHLSEKTIWRKLKSTSVVFLIR